MVRDPIRDHKHAAKLLLRAYKAAEPDAVRRVRAVIHSANPEHPATLIRGVKPVGLQKCQHVIAVEHGYADWSDLLDGERAG